MHEIEKKLVIHAILEQYKQFIPKNNLTSDSYHWVSELHCIAILTTMLLAIKLRGYHTSNNDKLVLNPQPPNQEFHRPC